MLVDWLLSWYFQIAASDCVGRSQPPLPPWTSSQQSSRSESVIVRNPELVPSHWLDNIERLRSSYMAFQMEQQRQSDYYHHQHQALPSLLNVKRNHQEREESYEDNLPTSSTSNLAAQIEKKARRGRPRKHAPKIPLPPLYVFIRWLGRGWVEHYKINGIDSFPLISLSGISCTILPTIRGSSPG